MKEPADGTYSLPQPAVSQYNGLGLKVLIVSEGKTRLSCSDDNGHVGTNDWNYVEFKASLPLEERFQQIGTGTTEEQIEGSFGKPTWVQPPTWRWKGGMSSDTRIVHYAWFTASPMSELIFMRVTASYTKNQDGVWTLRFLKWEKWGDRKFLSETADMSRSNRGNDE